MYICYMLWNSRCGINKHIPILIILSSAPGDQLFFFVGHVNRPHQCRLTAKLFEKIAKGIN